MAETLLSPGVLARETDQSFIQGQPLQAGAAIVGPAAKGPVGIPTLVTSPSEYEAIFGGIVVSGSQQYSYLTRTSAQNYFSQGGDSLLVTRVVSGSFTSATSTAINNTNGDSAITLETLDQGILANSAAGTKDNIKWEITGVDMDRGLFSLLVRRGDDIHKSKTILETFSNLSLDPKAPNYITKRIGNTTFSIDTTDVDPYIKSDGEFVNQSKYIRVSTVNTPTLDFFDNNGDASAAHKSRIPLAGSGSFSGAAGDLFPGAAARFGKTISGAGNIQGLTHTDYTESLDLLSNTDDYKFNLISVPGLNHTDHAATVNKAVTLAETRQDCIAIVDLRPYGATVANVTTSATAFDSSYAATYWPWLQTIDPSTAQTVWVPASTMIPGVYAFTDRSSEAWFAPAGLTRGALGNVTKAERKLTAGNRDKLYTSNVNPIATFPGQGVVVFGQKTLQKKSSALDRVNVRRLLIELKSYISQVADNLVFEQNSIATRNGFLTTVNPYLEGIQQRQGLYAFKVVMDETNNTADVVDRNELIGQIYLQPTKTAEFIMLDFNVTPTGASFPA